jgi:hypothetical protein
MKFSLDRGQCAQVTMPYATTSAFAASAPHFGNQPCSNSPATRVLLLAVLAICGLFSSPGLAWTLISRELVDVQFLADDSIVVLVSAPGADTPGLYRWRDDNEPPKQLCSLSFPASFSFDRKTVIERVTGSRPALRLYTASSCRLVGEIDIDGDVLDADSRGTQVAMALKTNEGEQQLRVYSLRRSKPAQLLTSTTIGRNVEIGFAPDGRSIVNFDPSDAGTMAWRVPSLRLAEMPQWTTTGETTFVPGSSLVKHYREGILSMHQWPGGTTRHKVATALDSRVRQLSANGQFALLHSRIEAHESLNLLDFGNGRQMLLASGGIDHASINAAGNRVAWAQRVCGRPDQVQIRRAAVNPAGALIFRDTLISTGSEPTSGLDSRCVNQ